MCLSRFLKFCGAFAVLAAFTIPEVSYSAPRTARATIKFEKKMREVLNFVNNEGISTVLGAVGDLPEIIDKMTCGPNTPTDVPQFGEEAPEVTCPIYEDSKLIEREIQKILDEGPIDLRLNFQELYQLILQQKKAKMTYNSMGGLIAEAQAIKAEISGLSPDPGTLRGAADAYEAKAAQIQAVANKVKEMGEIGSGQSPGSMKGKIASLIQQIQGMQVSSNLQAVLAALVIELESLRGAVDENPEMSERELDAMSCIIPGLFDFAGSIIEEFAALYKGAASALDSLADQIEKAAEEGEPETPPAEGEEGEEEEPAFDPAAALEALADSFNGKIAAFQSRASAAVAEVAALEAQIQEYRTKLARTERFRIEEDKINKIQKPICDSIITYNNATLAPQKLFDALGQQFVEHAKATKALSSEFKSAKPAALTKQVTAAAKFAQKVMLKDAAVPQMNADQYYVNACGNLYSEPQPPNAPVCGQAPQSDVALTFIARGFSFGSPGGSGGFGGGTPGGFTGGFPGFNNGGTKPGGQTGGKVGGKTGGKKLKCKNYRCPRSKINTTKSTDKTSRLLYKAAKKFMKNKREEIRKAYRRAYNSDMAF